MKVTPHSPRAAFVGVDQLPVSSEARPKPLSDEDAEAVVQDALELLGDVSFKQVFWDNRWLRFWQASAVWTKSGCLRPAATACQSAVA